MLQIKQFIADENKNKWKKTKTAGEVSQLIVWRFEPSQPLGIISGLKETVMKRYVGERTYETEIRQEEQSEKTGSCWENLRNETV